MKIALFLLRECTGPARHGIVSAVLLGWPSHEVYHAATGRFKSLQAHVPTPQAGLAELVTGLKRPEERMIAINLGLALEDLAVVPEIFRRARVQ